LKLRTRFAPSPTGLLHVGNAYSALICQQWAEQHDAELLLRIEDIDHTRCHDEHATQLIEDLQWLGLEWQGEVIKQSEHLSRYRKAFDQLQSMGVVYPCFCTRKEIQQEIERIGIAPHAEDMADPYPGSCREINEQQRLERMKHEPFAWRLNSRRAMEIAGEALTWQDKDGHHHPVQHTSLGDMVIGRKDIGFSYHLAVVVDDAAQSITHVIRGEDLIDSTPIHALLQKLLNLPSPVYLHHPLLLDGHGERLAKRNSSTTLQSLREAGCDAEKLRHHLISATTPTWPFGDESPEQIIEQLGIGS